MIETAIAALMIVLEREGTMTLSTQELKAQNGSSMFVRCEDGTVTIERVPDRKAS